MRDTASIALKYCGIDVSKSTLVCAAIGDLDEHNRHFLPGQANDLGLVGEEPVVKRSFSNSWSGLDKMTRWMQSIGVSVAVMESTGVQLTPFLKRKVSELSLLMRIRSRVSQYTRPT